MEFLEYLEPVELEKPGEHVLVSRELFSHSIIVHTASISIGDLSNYNLALLGIPEDRNSYNKGSVLAPNAIRSELYKLISPVQKLKIIDLGNLRQGNTFGDTYFALKDLVYHLLCNNLTIVLVGGSQELTVPAFQAFEKYQDKINLVAFDSKIDLQKDAINFTSDSYLNELLLKKSKLFKFATVGHQSYLTEKSTLELMNRLLHDTIRLGEVRSDIKKIEPLLRDADIVSFDIGAIRQSDSPGHFRPNPNGFYSEESCQLARYAGTSDMVRCFGIFEANAKLDHNNHTSALAAQMLWHFIDGLENRNVEYPGYENNNFKTFIVAHEDLDYDMTFFRSLKTDRWWLEVPRLKEGGKTIISCTYDDYITACNHEVPDIWWKTFQKLS